MRSTRARLPVRSSRNMPTGADRLYQPRAIIARQDRARHFPDKPSARCSRPRPEHSPAQPKTVALETRRAGRRAEGRVARRRAGRSRLRNIKALPLPPRASGGSIWCGTSRSLELGLIMAAMVADRAPAARRHLRGDPFLRRLRRPSRAPDSSAIYSRRALLLSEGRVLAEQRGGLFSADPAARRK